MTDTPTAHLRQPLTRRVLLKKVAVGALLPAAAGRLHAALAAKAPLLDPAAPEAKAVKYVEDASKLGAAAAGNNCANCGLYQGSSGTSQGPCQLFAGKLVKAAGWCSSWAPQM